MLNFRKSITPNNPKKVSIIYEIYKTLKKSKPAFFFAFILPIIVGVYFFYIGVKEIGFAKESTMWSSVRGTITQSIYTDYHARSSGSGNARGAPSMALHYEYIIGGETFTGDRVFYGYKNNFLTSDSYRQSQAYPKGENVTVYYDPTDPIQSVLEPGINFPYSWNKIMLALILMIPLYLIIKYEFLHKGEKSEDDKQ